MKVFPALTAVLLVFLWHNPDAIECKHPSEARQPHHSASKSHLGGHNFHHRRKPSEIHRREDVASGEHAGHAGSVRVKRQGILENIGRMVGGFARNLGRGLEHMVFHGRNMVHSLMGGFRPITTGPAVVRRPRPPPPPPPPAKAPIPAPAPPPVRVPAPAPAPAPAPQSFKPIVSKPVTSRPSIKFEPNQISSKPIIPNNNGPVSISSQFKPPSSSPTVIKTKPSSSSTFTPTSSFQSDFVSFPDNSLSNFNSPFPSSNTFNSGLTSSTGNSNNNNGFISSNNINNGFSSSNSNGGFANSNTGFSNSNSGFSSSNSGFTSNNGGFTSNTNSGFNSNTNSGFSSNTNSGFNSNTGVSSSVQTIPSSSNSVKPQSPVVTSVVFGQQHQFGHPTDQNGNIITKNPDRPGFKGGKRDPHFSNDPNHINKVQDMRLYYGDLTGLKNRARSKKSGHKSTLLRRVRLAR